MPVAHCIVRSDCYQKKQEGLSLIDLWASACGKPSGHMTVNIMTSAEQHGNAYAVMANLILPDMWAGDDIDSLQIGLATALARYFNLSTSDIHVITHVVSSGLVVEDGSIIKW